MKTPPVKEKKEKKQITLRIDTQLRDAALKALEVGAFPEGTEFIDVIERGMHLAIAEWDQLSTQEKQVRFMICNTTKDQQRVVRGLLIAMVDPRPVTDVEHSEEFAQWHAGLHEKFWEFAQWFLMYCNELPNARALIESYGNYGKKKKNDAKVSK